jgi:hypothetical protein
MADDRQRIELGAAQSQRESRPLRTGQGFDVVLPTMRIVIRRWDKVSYEPGEECTISILGLSLGKAPLPVTIETQKSDGSWTSVAKLNAEISSDQREAVAKWRFPQKLPESSSVRETDGSALSDARFEETRDIREGGPVWVTANAQGFEGKQLQVVLEREEAGQWVAAGQAVATVKSGKLRAAVTMDKAKPASR